MKNRRQVWIDENLYLDVQFLVQEMGYTIKGFIEQSIIQALKKEGKAPSRTTYVIQKGNSTIIKLPINYGECKDD